MTNYSIMYVSYALHTVVFLEIGFIYMDVFAILCLLQPYTLPSIPGQHEDLKCLTPETVSWFSVISCIK